MNKTIEIQTLIFKSVEYLDFIYKQLTGPYCKAEGWDVKVRIVANDATQQVLTRLRELDICQNEYNDPIPDDYYMNRVYRACNYMVKQSDTEHVCIINSDMAFSEGWLDNLLKHHDGTNIPVSRLVESGKMPSGAHGISLNFGRTPKEFNAQAFESYANAIKVNKIEPDGLYGPVIFEKKRFIESGMYPEGNVYEAGIGRHGSGDVIRSGDDYYFNGILSTNFKMTHITVFDSIVYHIQEGEKSVS